MPMIDEAHGFCILEKFMATNMFKQFASSKFTQNKRVNLACWIRFLTLDDFGVWDFILIKLVYYLQA